jgi:hypothetical protein
MRQWQSQQVLLLQSQDASRGSSNIGRKFFSSSHRSPFLTAPSTVAVFHVEVFLNSTRCVGCLRRCGVFDGRKGEAAASSFSRTLSDFADHDRDESPD